MKYYLLMMLWACLFVFNLSAGELDVNLDHSLESFSLFEGDRHGQFKGNLVAHLNDGSVWKVHPYDETKFSSWNIDEKITVEIRTSRYFFKREHKFALKNKTKNEEVRAMLVQYSDEPLMIVAHENYVSGSQWKWVPVFNFNGEIQNQFHLTNRFSKIVHLNDGSKWIIKAGDPTNIFYLGAKVYVSANQYEGSWLFNPKTYYFIIKGTEREAECAWILPCAE